MTDRTNAQGSLGPGKNMVRTCGRGTLRVWVLLVVGLSLSQVGLGDELGLEVQVVAVLDGDTLEIETGGRSRRLEVADIDCPELEQPYGDEARNMTRNLVGDTTIYIGLREMQPGGTLTASIRLLDGRDLAGVLARAGLGWWVGSGGDVASTSPLPGLERRARVERKGLWKDEDPVPPWVFRGEPRPRTSGTSNPKPPTATASPSPARKPPTRRCRPRSECCRICSKGQACGNSCISVRFNCHKGRGCACNSYEIC